MEEKTEFERLEARILAKVTENLDGKSGEIVNTGGLTYERLYIAPDVLAGWRIADHSISVKVGFPERNNKLKSLRVAAILLDLDSDGH